MTRLSDEELLEELQRRFKENKEDLEELKQLMNELKTVNKKLEDSEALKSHFISNITNEIINPFTSILGLSKSILSVKKEDWKTVIAMVALIHSEAFTLDFQLRNIFVAAKIEAGEIYPEILNTDIKSLFNNVLDSFKFEAKKKNLNFEYKFDIASEGGAVVYFKTDPEKLKLIMSNLMSNAVKFSYDKGNIILHVWQENALLNVGIQDFGAGISEENQKIIFDRFKRLDNGINSINRGHGLGLSITKALLDLLDGSIEVRSQKGKGSAFTISIPESQSGIAGFSSDGNDFLFENDEIF